ncbi:MAG: hypothetical protein GY750_18515 [Lentisphaerae bacterium]|nr:hypothetical protein [Lentisphaerota bacterium]MCP4103392.1 hypothetical protein [Lentisphaerota bacterium]
MNSDNVLNLLPAVKAGDRPKVAIFLSGSGTNAEKLLESHDDHSSWQPVVLVTDRPKTSRAFELGKMFGLPVIALGIKDFYNRHGEKQVTLFTERGRELREMWTEQLRREVEPYNIDFIVLAGFVPLTNITNDFPCLNVHPGDLTVEEKGRRVLVGLHTVPIEEALVRGFYYLRSSVIMAQPYTGEGDDMDSGPVLGISAPVKAFTGEYQAEYLTEIRENRPSQKPFEGWRDSLEVLALKNQDILKEAGDWVVLPGVVEDFAADRFGIYGGQLFYRAESTSEWKQIKTIEYSINGKSLIYQDS